MRYLLPCILVVVALSGCSIKEMNKITDGIKEIGDEGSKVINSEG